MQIKKQIAFSFDSITKSKIITGALIAGTGTGAIAMLEYLGRIDWTDKGIMASTFVAWLVPTAVNAIREWMKG